MSSVPAPDTQIMLKVPQEVIDAQVRAAVAAALGKDPTRLVRAVVDAALKAPSSSYSPHGESLFSQQCNAMIREVAQQEFAAFLVEQRPAIALQIREALGKTTKGLVDKLAAKCAEGVLNLRLEAWVPREGS